MFLDDLPLFWLNIANCSILWRTENLSWKYFTASGRGQTGSDLMDRNKTEMPPPVRSHWVEPRDVSVGVFIISQYSDELVGDVTPSQWHWDTCYKPPGWRAKYRAAVRVREDNSNWRVICLTTLSILIYKCKSLNTYLYTRGQGRRREDIVNCQ